MSEAITMILRAGLLAWTLGALVACGSRSGGTSPMGAGGAVSGIGGAIGSGGADGIGGQSGVAGMSGAGGFVSSGAVDTAPAVYIVPAGPDTPEVRYAIDAPSTKTNSGEFRIDYTMPALLVGGDQMISLRGTLDAQGRLAIVAGDAGSATCDLAPGDGFSVRCDETLTGIQVDLGEVQRTAQSLPAPLATLFVGVASRFSGEPIGIVEIR
jgi:hypothetical protein